MRLLRQKLYSYKSAKRYVGAIRAFKNAGTSVNNFTYKVNQSLRNWGQPDRVITMRPPIIKDTPATTQEVKNTARKVIIKANEAAKNIQQTTTKVSNTNVGEALMDGTEFVIRKPHVAAAVLAAQGTTPAGAALVAKGGLANAIVGTALFAPGYTVSLPTAANKLNVSMLPEGLPRKIGSYIPKGLNKTANLVHNSKPAQVIRNSTGTVGDYASVFGNIM